jgi:diguanylate cyclase (GGDEF)-like protein/PAS domain S-box-containing protein
MNHLMFASTLFSEQELQNIEKVMRGAALSSACPNGILLAENTGEWVEILRCGHESPCEVSENFEAIVRTATTYGDIVVISEGEYGLQNLPHHGFYYEPGGTLLCITIRCENLKVCGALILGNAQQKIPLSLAQRYALQTQAAELAQLLHFGPQIFQAATLPVERLRLLESVVINAKDSILITDAEPYELPGPRIVYANPAFEKTTGYSVTEVIGKTPRILQSEKTSRATLDRIRQALATWQSIEVELVNARKDGSLFWVELSIVPVADENGWFTHWISVQRDITQRKEAERMAEEAHSAWEERVVLQSRLQERERISEELSYAAYHDELTALHNRAYLMAHLAEIFKAQGNQRAVSVLFIDLDGFKLINDSLGHLAGDELLETVARRLQKALRSEDVLARLGGDEFAILITSPDHAAVARDLPQRIINRLSQPITLRDQDVYVSCSIGVASADHRHIEPDDLLRDADVAMYSAKKQGRGRWTWFNSSMRDAAVKQLLVQNALRQAVVDRDFVIYYQPIYSGRNRSLVGVEALLRWKHPQLGIVQPETFITLAEDLGVIHELGAWVMKTAAEEVQAWRTRYPDLDIALNVNVSGKELTREAYVEQVEYIIRESGITPGAIQIEVTETVFLLQPDIVAGILTDLRALGVKIGLDDFGTGYSSLSYIDRYPIDAVKIDKSFISRMMLLPRSRAIVESILSLGRSLNLDIVAEGVETGQQFEMLVEMECPYIQGYYLSQPLEKEKIALLLQDEITNRKPGDALFN